MVFKGFLLGAQRKGNNVEKKTASLFAVSLCRVPHGIPPSPCGKQATGPPSLPVAVPTMTKKLTSSIELIPKEKKKKNRFFNPQICQFLSETMHEQRTSVHCLKDYICIECAWGGGVIHLETRSNHRTR